VLRTPLSLLTVKLCAATAAAALVLVVATAHVGKEPAPRAAPRPQPPTDFRLPGPQGEPIVVQLPELSRIPPLDLAAACPLVAAHNDNARKNAEAAPGEGWNSHLYRAAEAGCADAGRRAHLFYDELGRFFGAGREPSRFDALQAVAAMREALRTATTAKDVVAALKALDVVAPGLAEPLHAPDFFLITAEAVAVRVLYCDGEDAARCRRESHARRGQDLLDAGHWRADASLVRAGIAAYREALRETAAGSPEWVELHTSIGNGLAQLSEQYAGPARLPLLREALDEYELAGAAADPADRSTWARINQNLCSIRQPLAAIDRDRADMRRAMAECDQARAYYQERDEKSREAAALYNTARAEGSFADWDRDEAAAIRAVEHVRRTVQLHARDGAALSRAFGQIHLAEALLFASNLVDAQPADAGRQRSRAMMVEAQASLDAAEPILREAQARSYLERLTAARGRLDRAQGRN
jgi:hypothetical protein